MGRFIGVDIRSSHVRAVVVRTVGRRVLVERMLEVDRLVLPELGEAVGAAVKPLLEHGEPVAVAVEGDRAFLHWLKLPASAQRQLGDVLPYEIEAHVPVDIDELVYDHRVIASSPAGLTVLTGAARTEHVRERIALCRAAFGHAPERVGCGALSLVGLAPLIPNLVADRPVAIVDLAATYTEILVVLKGEPVFARTLSRGLAALPEGAAALAAEVRQTLAAYAVQGGEPVERVELVGHVVGDPYAREYLGYHLGVEVSLLDELAVEGVEPAERPLVARFAKAISLALSLAPKARDLNLRQGSLVERRGYAFVREKAPLLTGLLVAIFISFSFATWAEMRALAREKEALTATLRTLSAQMLGEETEDPEAVFEIIDRGSKGDGLDPMPHADAFDVFIELSKGIPMELPHDVEELDLKRGKVKLQGIVKSKTDAQKVEGILGKWECAKNVKLGKITQVVNSENQKYLIELDLECPADKKKEKKPVAAATPAEGSGEGAP